MKTYYEKNFGTGVLNNNAGHSGASGQMSGRTGKQHQPLSDIFIPVQLSKHQTAQNGKKMSVPKPKVPDENSGASIAKDEESANI